MDPKGRVIIPARFRKALVSDDEYDLVITNKDRCLYAYTFSEWENIENKLKAARGVHFDDFKRFFLGNAAPLKCDKQDRVLIPQSLRAYAGIKKNIVLVGVLTHFEIWDRERWDQKSVNIEETLQRPEVQEAISSIGL